MESCGPRNISRVGKYAVNLHRAEAREAPPLKKYAGCSSVTRCLSASGLNCLFVFLLSFLSPLFPFAASIQRRCHLGCFLLLPVAPPDQTTRIRSSNCNMCQTALNLEPPRPPRRSPSVTRFWCFYRPRRSVFVKKKGACERRAVALAVAIEVIKEGWNCRLWNRRSEAGASREHRRKIKTPNYPSELRRVRRDRAMEGKPRKKRSPYNLPCGETSISLARSVRHRVISRR